MPPYGASSRRNVPGVQRLLLLVAIAAAIAAVVAVNALLLGYGSDRNNRVGNLNPGAVVPVTPAPPVTTTTEGGREPDD